MLPIPFSKSRDWFGVNTCCSTVVCDGCIYAKALRGIEERLPETCPFCRCPLPSTDAECNLYEMKRVKANDPVALSHAGTRRFEAGDYATAIDYWQKAAGLGDIQSHYDLSFAFEMGYGVEIDKKKTVHHWEQLPLVAMLSLGTILDVRSSKNATLTGQCEASHHRRQSRS